MSTQSDPQEAPASPQSADIITFPSGIQAGSPAILDMQAMDFFSFACRYNYEKKTPKQKELEARVLTVLEETHLGRLQMREFLLLPVTEITCQWGMALRVYETLQELAKLGGFSVKPFRPFTGYKIKRRKVRRYPPFQR